MKQLFYMTCLMMLFTACSKDDDDAPTPQGPAQRTVVVYMSGENSLTGFIHNDLEEMKKGRLNVAATENLLVFVDGVSQTEKPYIAKITANGELQMLHTYPNDFYASDPDNMRDVIERAVEACPAKEYGLVLWGHADGWIINKDSIATETAHRAYGVDNGSNVGINKGIWLNIPSMRQSFELLPFKWRFILFDCCNMMTAEVAYELKDVADYLIGAPAEIPGHGAPYEQVVPALFLQTDDFYKSIVDSYATAYPQKVVLSVVNTSRMESLAQATQQVLPLLNDYAQKTSLDNHIYYHAIKVNEIRKTIHHDMREVAYKALDAAAYHYWMSAFSEAVVYSYYSPSWITNGTVLFDFTMSKDYWGGLSMFFPMNKYETATDSVNETIKQMGWYYAVGWSEVGW